MCISSCGSSASGIYGHQEIRGVALIGIELSSRIIFKYFVLKTIFTDIKTILRENYDTNCI